MKTRPSPGPDAGPQGNETNQYDPAGNRTYINGASADPAGGQVEPAYDTIGNPILDQGGDKAPWVYRVYGPGIDEPLAEWRRTNSQITYIHHDAQNSVTAATNSSGQVVYRETYGPYGGRSTFTVNTGITQSRLGWTSRETSIGNLMFNRARHYDIATGRFMQQDTYRGEDTNPPSLHRYVYCLNNPVILSDPLGLGWYTATFDTEYLAIFLAYSGGGGGIIIWNATLRDPSNPLGSVQTGQFVSIVGGIVLTPLPWYFAGITISSLRLTENVGELYDNQYYASLDDLSGHTFFGSIGLAIGPLGVSGTGAVLGRVHGHSSSPLGQSGLDVGLVLTVGWTFRTE